MRLAANLLTLRLVPSLEESNQCGRLPAEHLQAIREVALERAFQQGEVIFREGDKGDGVYLVGEGSVEISASLQQGGRKVLSKAGPDDLIGEMAVIDDAPRSATAMAFTTVKLYFVPRETAVKLLQEKPAISLGLLKLISHRLRESNIHYLKEMLQAERLSVVGMFTRAIMHDLKNPLNLIGLTAEVAALPNTGAEDRKKAAANIHKQIEKITSLISEVLEFSSGPVGKVILATMPYSTFMRGLIDEFLPQAEQRNIQLRCDTSWPEVTLPLDPKRLQRAFSNLLVNALEAMPNGGTIEIRARVQGSEIVTEIEDSGPGIAPQIAERLFEPFATYGKAFGTGLGLSICRRIVEDHRGWVLHRSESDKGAIFAIGLPISTRDADRTSHRQEPTS